MAPKQGAKQISRSQGKPKIEHQRNCATLNGASGPYPSEWFDEFLAPFEPFVASGQLIRRIIDTPMSHLKQHRPDLEGMRDVFFAVPSEEWRIDAYINKIKNRISDWDDDLERLQGSLLGYEDWQNDWWIEQRVKRQKAAT